MKKLVVSSLQLAVFIFVICGQAWGAGVTDWWNANYSYRKLISCGDHAQYETDHFINITEDVTGAKFMDNGNDIRIVYQTTAGQTDLGRYVVGVNTSTAFIYWKVQATVPLNEDIGGEDDYKYYLYYDYSSAGSPETYTNVDCIDAPYSVDGNTVALWHIEEASTPLYDETANDNDVIVENSAFGQTGKFGKCVKYDGTASEYAHVVWYEADPPSAAMTIDFWVAVDRDSQAILGFNEDSPAGNTYDRAFCIDGADRIRWKVYEDAAGPAVLCTSTTNLSNSTWYHVAGVIDVSDGAKLYIDGTLEATTAGTDGGYMGYTDVEFLMANGDDGGWEMVASIPMYFDGAIDEIRISDVTRTAFHHNATIGTLTLGAEEEAPADGVDKPRKNIMSGGILK